MTLVGAADRLGGRAWSACGASVTGSMHLQRGLGCDDAYSYGIAGDFVVAAVADGAGSVSGTSSWGAHVACQSVLDSALRPAFIDSFRTATPDQDARLIRSVFDGALERVHRQADAMGLDVALLSTTLCVALANRDRAVFGQVGDGVIAAERDGIIDTLLIEHKDEYANTTSFIQSERGLDETLRTITLPGVTAFGLSTDGMSYKITDVATGAAYEPFFRGCWQHVRSGASADSFAALLDGIEDDQTGDDKTMVLVVIRDDDVSQSASETWLLVTDSSAPPQSGTHWTAEADAETEPLATRPVQRRRRWWGR